MENYMTIPEAMEYIRTGRNKTIEFAKEIGAVHHVGRRIIIDRRVIDDYFKAETEKQLAEK